MNPSNLTPATFIVNDNDLVHQTNINEDILSETVITSNAIIADVNSLAKTEVSDIKFADRLTFPKIENETSPTITIEAGDFFTEDTDSIEANQHSFEHLSFFDPSNSDVTEIQEPSIQIIESEFASFDDSVANIAGMLKQSDNHLNDSNSIVKEHTKFSVNDRRPNFKIMKKDEFENNVKLQNRVTIRNKPTSSISLTAVTHDGDMESVEATPQPPPPGAVSKLARNATLIDLGKIRNNHGRNKQFLIDEVTVMIDDSDKVKVMDYGSDSSKSDTKSHSDFVTSDKIRLFNRHKKQHFGSFVSNSARSNCLSGGNFFTEHEMTYLSSKNTDGPLHRQFEDANLLVALDQMRRLRVDCNVCLVDQHREHAVYAHRLVLIARSPYLYKQLYVRRKKANLLLQFCRFTLPSRINFNAVEAVVSYMYSGSLNALFGAACDSKCVLKVLQLFEMTDAVEMFSIHLPEDDSKILTIKNEPVDVEPFLMHPVFGSPAEEVTIDERKKRKKVIHSQRENCDLGNLHHRLAEKHYEGSLGNSGSLNMTTNTSSICGFMINSAGEEVRMKTSVQKLVDSSLAPFLCKFEELFDPQSHTMQVSKSSQHIITLWNPDLLLTKLFDQNELTKFFTDYVNEIKDFRSFNIERRTSNVGSYVVETLNNTSGLDEEYVRVGTSDSVVPEVETLTVGDMQIINYTQIESRHIPRYVRLISLYKFRVVVGGVDDSKLNILTSTSLVHGEEQSAGQFHNSIIEDLSSSATNNSNTAKNDETMRYCVKKVSQDLSRRVVADLDSRLNINYHEEMIMHIVVEQVEKDGVLPFMVGIFLAKACAFCRKRECKAEDLTTPIGPDNPVCPDRQCIRRNLICSICNKQMSNSKSLARHKYSVHDAQGGESGGIYICSHCGDTFSKKWKLNVHEKQHEDRKLQLSCQFCHKILRGEMALKKHINMVHETKRQYPCQFCSKLFKRKETLAVHVRIHTGEKPFVCSHCDYSSETKGNLKAHTIRKHKRALLATSVDNHGIETSITAPLQMMEEMGEEECSPMEANNIVSTSEIVTSSGGGQDLHAGAAGAVLESPALRLEEAVEAGGGTNQGHITTALVAHPSLQENAYILS